MGKRKAYSTDGLLHGRLCKGRAVWRQKGRNLAEEPKRPADILAEEADELLEIGRYAPKGWEGRRPAFLLS